MSNRFDPRVLWGSLILSASISGLTVPSAVRAEAEPTRVVYSDTVRVSASKTRSRLAQLSTSASIVSPEQLRLGTAHAMQDVLAQLPGVNILDLSGTGTGGAVEARGFAAQGTTSSMLVLIDGMAINDPESGRVDWNLLDPSQVERVEVLRGPSSFLYGSSTLAGLVNIVTRAPRDAASGWGELRGGSNGRAAASGGATWSSARMRGGVSTSLAADEGERANSRSDRLSAQASWSAAWSPRWALRAQLRGSNLNRRVPGPLTAPAWQQDPMATTSPDDFRDERTGDGELGLTLQCSSAWELSALGGGALREVDAFETIQPVGGLGRTSRTRGAHAELRARRVSTGAWVPSLLMGLETKAGRLESRYAAQDPRVDPLLGAADVALTQGGAYALLDQKLAAGVSVQAGARVDWTRSRVDDPTDALPVSANDDQRSVSPSIALHWARPGQAHAWLAYAGAFKTPELEQLYDPRPYDLGFGPLRISNHALQAQRDDHWDAGTRTRIGSVWCDGAVYYARSRNELGFDYANFRISNIARSRHAGFEGMLSLPAKAGWSGSASYAYTRATFEGGEFDGKQINTVPRQQLFARVSYEHRLNGSISLEAQHLRDQWIDEANSRELPAYTVVNLGVRQQAGPLECFATVRNLADASYATVGFVALDSVGDPLPLYFPASGRNVLVGFRLGATR